MMVRATDLIARTGMVGHPSVIVLLLALLAVPRSAGNAQGPVDRPTEDGGRLTFRLTHFGAAAGEETFQVQEDPERGTILVTAQAKAALGGRTLELTQRLDVRREGYALQEYDLTVLASGESQSIRAFRQEDSVIVAAEARAGSFRRAFFESGEVFVLDNLLANHLALLGKRIAADGFRAETLRVAVPQVGMVFSAAIVPQPLGQTGERTVELRVTGTTEILHFDAAGRVDRIEVPSQGIRYEMAAPGESAEARPPAKAGDEATASEAPASPARRLYNEEIVRFVSAGTDLDGILTLPRGGQRIPYPAVLFVHGSGPHDRDETIGPNRPFHDLAHSLAVFGIASFRYDKRTLAAPKTFDAIHGTVNEEVIDDAVAALEALRSQSRIDRKALVVLGHGLGGSLAAAIANRGGPVAGLVLLAASPRPLEELLRDQLTYLRNQAADQGILSGVQEKMYEELFGRIDSLQAGTLSDRSVIVGMTARYLRDYRQRDLAAELTKFRGPALFLQGGKDYQVTRTDFDLWKQITEAGGKANATFRYFPDLGPLFMPIEGEAGPASLVVPGNIEPAVIEEIAKFVEAMR